VVEERRPTHGVTQRRFEVEPSTPVAPAAPVPVPSLPGPAPAKLTDAPPPAPQRPSDLELRERQMRWLKERDRFVAARSSESGPPPG
jgi:hypothetical protein